MPAPTLPQRRLKEVFRQVRAHLSKKFPRLKKASMGWCGGVRTSLRTGRRRAFMHVGHKSNSHVCVWPGTDLSEPYLYGLFLHEFGHIGQGESESGADLWIMEHFGIPIEYKGPLCLEWVNPLIIWSRFHG